jgi:hypothetical protein
VEISNLVCCPETKPRWGWGKQPTWCCREIQAETWTSLADTPIDTIKEQFATENIAATVDSKRKRNPSAHKMSGMSLDKSPWVIVLDL